MKRKTLLLLAALLWVFLPAGCGESPEGEEKTDMQTLIRSMTQSPYADGTLNTEAYGLTSPEEVGVDRAKFENEIRYPVSGDEAFSAGAVFEVRREGGIDGLRRALQEAKTVNEGGQPVKIRLPSGEFRLSMDGVGAGETYLLHVEGFDGLHIEGNDTVLVMENDGSQWIGFMEFSDCRDVVMQDVTLDYAVAPVLSGRLTALDTGARRAEVTLAEEFLDPWGDFGEIRLKSYVEIGENAAPFPGGNHLYDSGDAQNIASCRFEDGKAVIEFREDLAQTPLNTRVSLAVTMYGNNAIHFEECENARLETVTVYTCPGMAVTAMKCRDLYWNRVNVRLKEGSSRLMTATADAMHLTSCTGDVIISNCLIENTHDDGINIKSGFYMSVASVSYGAGRVVLDGYSDENLPLNEGDRVEIYTPALEYVTTLTARDIVTSGRSYAFSPPEDIFDLEPGLYAGNVSCSPDFTFENNIIRNKRNRGMLIQVRGARIRNCTFSNIAHGSINVISELATGAREAMMPRDILFENCKFLTESPAYAMPFANIVYGEDWTVTPDVIRGVQIENCFLSAASGTAVLIWSGTECSIRNNFFYGLGEQAYLAVDLKGNSGNTVSGNFADVGAFWSGGGDNTVSDNQNITHKEGE